MSPLRRVAASLLLLLWALAATRTVLAEQRRSLVLVLERPGAPPRLHDALRIQLPRDVALEQRRLVPALSVARRVRAASDLLEQRRGLLVIWIEQDSVVDGQREVTAYFVGARDDRALVEVVSVRADASEELERVVALKALEVVDALREQPNAGVLEPFAAGSGAGSPSLELAFATELGGSGATPGPQAPARVAVHAGLGAVLRSPSLRLEVLAIGRVPTASSRREAAGELRASEVDVLLSARALWRSEPIALGGFTDFGARFVSVEGTTAAGASGSDERAFAVLGVGPEARFGLATWLDLRLAAGLETALTRQRFTLNGETVLDLGRYRGVCQLSLVGALP